MSTHPSLNSTVYIERNMNVADCIRTESGSMTVFSSRSPDKETVNEDAAAIIVCNDGTLVLIVADGVGGMRAGAQASATTIDILQSTITTADPQIRDAVLSGIERANQVLMESSSGSATTLAIVEINGNEIRPYHVGDSMILVTGQRGKVKLETVSHSPVGYAVEAGILTEDDAFLHAERHLVSNVVGSSGMHISVGMPLTLDRRDTLLIASDGLFDNLQKEEIIEFMRKGPLTECARALVRHAGARMRDTDLPGKPDDMTFILYRQD